MPHGVQFSLFIIHTLQVQKYRLNATVHKLATKHERGWNFRFRFNEEGVKFEFDLS